jgi:uncharacterized protein
MTAIAPGLFRGKVVHRRLRPVLHELSYDVATVLVDVDQLHALPAALAYNRFGLFSIHDRDHGPRDQTQSLSAFAWGEMRKHQAPPEITRILMLSYPRVLGYTFNPLTVFYGFDAADNMRMLLYEVHNTFGGRHVYAAGPFTQGEATFAQADKTFRVSPFNKVEGHYGLRASRPAAEVAVGVSLSTAEGPLLKAYFTGQRQPLGNAQLLKVFFSLPLMTLKVMAGIHWEALKLWRKGLKLQQP